MQHIFATQEPRTNDDILDVGIYRDLQAAASAHIDNITDLNSNPPPKIATPTPIPHTQEHHHLRHSAANYQ